LGTRQLLEILESICEGNGRSGDIELLEEISLSVKAGSLCGLGQTAPNPVLSTIRYFREEYEAHIEEKRCPAGTCKALISYEIDPVTCVGCGLCVKYCSTSAISGEFKGPHFIDQEICHKCGMCIIKCPPKVNAVKVISPALKVSETMIGELT